MSVMMGLNPNSEFPQPRAWLVPPQGVITEPVGFIWSGIDNDSVQVLLGMDLENLRTELTPALGDTGMTVQVIEGVEGLAMTDPEWDGDPTVLCLNPTCSTRHDVHLLCAERLYEKVKQPTTASN